MSAIAMKYAVLLLLGVALTACGEDDDAGGTSATGAAGGGSGGTGGIGGSSGANYSGSLGPAPDFSPAHGRIVMEAWLSYDQAALSGYFADGPPLKAHVESERIGNCRLVTYTATNCTPECVPPDLCIDGQCEPWPDRIDRGSLRWVWPDGDQLIDPSALLSYEATGQASVLGDASITIDEMTLTAPMVDPPLADGDWAATLDSRPAGSDATLSWTNPVAGARIRLHMTDCVGSHGGLAPAEIECEGPDAGELVLPGSFLDTLEAGDWSHGECGSHTFERYHAAAPQGDDTVRFETVSGAGFFYFPSQ